MTKTQQYWAERQEQKIKDLEHDWNELKYMRGGEEEDPMKIIEAEMAQYKPAIRDAVISNFSSKTADEVMTAAGKELVKEQITEDVNAIFAGQREVLRVSFGQFIIQ